MNNEVIAIDEDLSEVEDEAQTCSFSWGPVCSNIWRCEAVGKCLCSAAMMRGF